MTQSVATPPVEQSIQSSGADNRPARTATTGTFMDPDSDSPHPIRSILRQILDHDLPPDEEAHLRRLARDARAEEGSIPYEQLRKELGLE